MPFDSFELETYSVSVGSVVNRGPEWGYRYIRLTSRRARPRAGGFRRTAHLAFEPWFVPSWLGQVRRGGLEIWAWCPFEDFRDYYDVLRTERPIRVSFRFSDPDFRGDAELYYIEIEALEEPPGEGPAE
jgi:hypothetical protein